MSIAGSGLVSGNALNKENSRWWHQPEYEAVFLERLASGNGLRLVTMLASGLMPIALDFFNEQRPLAFGIGPLIEPDVG